MNLPPTTKAKNFTTSQLTSFFGSKEKFRKRGHEGIDIGTPVGTPISFKTGGQIINSYKTSSTEREANGGYGNYIDIKLDTGNVVRMAHLSSIASWANSGTKFSAGEIIALSGGAKGAPGSGRSGGPHIHFEQHQTQGLGQEETLRGKIDPVKNGAFSLVQSGGINVRKNGVRTAAAPRQQPNVSQYTSYSPSAYRQDQGQIVPFSVQKQQPQVMQGGGEMMMLSGPSEQDLLNSFYKRVLLNTV